MLSEAKHRPRRRDDRTMWSAAPWLTLRCAQGGNDRAPLPQLQDGVARALEEVAFLLAAADVQRRAEADRGEHRHRRELALRQHAVEVVDVDRHELDVGPRQAEAIQAALELAELRPIASRPLGEDDQRVRFAE